MYNSPINAVIGYNGFVGSIIARKQKHFTSYNSSNIRYISELEHDIIYCAGAQAKKWWANENPESDWNCIKLLIDSLENVKCNKLVLISTIGVYDNNAYGHNRKKLEDKLCDMFPDNISIYRLPAVFGTGLKKNLLFDLMNNTIQSPININDSFQWYNVNNIISDINSTKQNTVINEFFTEPISNKELLNLFSKKFDTIDDLNNCIVQNIIPATGYFIKKNNVLLDLKKFINGNN
jgi:hypothetical protein